MDLDMLQNGRRHLQLAAVVTVTVDRHSDNGKDEARATLQTGAYGLGEIRVSV